MSGSNRSEFVRVSIAMVVIALIGALNGSVRAATIAVTSTADSGAGSLRDTLAGAVNGDTVDATGVSGVITLTSGELYVQRNVTIVGPGPGSLAVDGNGLNRVFHIRLGKVVTISGLTITNGFLGDLQVPDINGAGIYNDHAILTVSNCTISGNSAQGNGGGIFNDGSSCSASLKISDSTVSGNHAGFGGGIFTGGVNDGNALLVLSGCTISGNSAADSGGGIFNTGESLGGGTLQIGNCTIAGNSAAENGGGIFNNGVTDGDATLQIANSTLSSNSASAGAGGGIFNYGVGGGFSMVEIGNTILNAGASGNNIANDSGTVVSRAYNLSSDGGGGFLTAATDLINTDPQLDPAGLQSNGGPTQTIAVQTPSSPAIDQGKRNTIAALASEFDQRGSARRIDFSTIPNAAGGDGSDIGAYEVLTACSDLTGSWSNVVQTCTNINNVLRCLVTGTWTERNVGTRDALSASITRFYLSTDATLDVGDTLLKSITYTTLKVKYPRVRLFSKLLGQVNASGQYIIAAVDADNSIAECNEKNNVIVAGPLP